MGVEIRVQVAKKGHGGCKPVCRHSLTYNPQDDEHNPAVAVDVVEVLAGALGVLKDHGITDNSHHQANGLDDLQRGWAVGELDVHPYLPSPPPRPHLVDPNVACGSKKSANRKQKPKRHKHQGAWPSVQREGGGYLTWHGD